MTARVTKKVEEAPTTIHSLVGSFLAGNNADCGNYHVAERNLYVGNRIVARLTKDSSVILPEQINVSVELNDELMGQIFLNQRKFRRIKGFDSLTNPVDRLSELKNGNYDDFRAISNLFGFNVDDDDFVALDRAKGLKTRVQEFFTQLQKEEEDRVRTAEERARAERAAKEAIDWDTGEGSASNSTVTGSGGGQRLRVNKKSTFTRTPTVETSTGHSLTLNQARRCWDFASLYWHGGKTLPSYGASKRITSSNGWRSNRRDVEVTQTHLKFGCQKVTRQEAERFADSMNWPRVKKAGS